MKKIQGNPSLDTILSFMRIATKLVGHMCQLVMMVTTYIRRFSLKVNFILFCENLLFNETSLDPVPHQ